MTGNSRNIVLVHGAWHGGWCWRDVAASLRATGHKVHTPTLTGLGERVHLLRADTGLGTCIDDICAVIDTEELTDVMLVGHSFAGVVISGVADRRAQSLSQLVYLDALLVQNGQNALSVFPPEVQRERQRTIDEEALRIAIPDASKFGVSDSQQVAWLQRQLTPHPLKTYTDPLILKHPLGNGLRKTYIAVTDPWYAPLAGVREWVRTQSDWDVRELQAGHDAMLTSPDALAALLVDLAR
jgi:pimeloyl-ACP methyl ester carboxylesterase